MIFFDIFQIKECTSDGLELILLKADSIAPYTLFLFSLNLSRTSIGDIRFDLSKSLNPDTPSIYGSHSEITSIVRSTQLWYPQGIEHPAPTNTTKLFSLMLSFNDVGIFMITLSPFIDMSDWCCFGNFDRPRPNP